MHPGHLVVRALLALALSSACPAQGPQFVVATPAALASTSWYRSWTVDVDGDGDLDLLGSPSHLIAGLALLRNDGGGVFIDVTAANLPTIWSGIGAASSVTAFDADGDGDVDLFATATGQPSVLLRNTGGGAFVIGQTIPVAFSQRGSAAADFDGDGDVDVAVCGAALLGSRDRVLLNDGSGQFPSALLLAIPMSTSLVAGDLDLDGDPDLLFFEQVGVHRMLRNDGGLVFTDVTASQLVLGSTAAVMAAVGFDLDQDGDLDLVLRAAAGGADVYVENVGGVLTAVGPLPGGGASDAIAVADVDGDGDLDVLRGSVSAGLELALNDGAGGFVAGAGRLPPQPIASGHVHLADLDGDGDADVISCAAASPTVALRNRDVDLEVGAALVGQPWTCSLRSRPGYATAPELMRLAVGLVRLSQPVALPLVGALWIDLAAPHALFDAFAPQPAGSATFSLSVPNAPALVGVTLHAQGLVGRGAALPRLTAWLPTTIG
ncbi:MAG: VCBS repeat-containing protein [Planctomycetes bacterium]|nr:VCBS repeat-containing protein [Planctomycetota bacterium]